MCDACVATPTPANMATTVAAAKASEGPGDAHEDGAVSSSRLATTSAATLALGTATQVHSAVTVFQTQAGTAEGSGGGGGEPVGQQFSPAASPGATSAEDWCKTIKCALDCEDECGWSRSGGVCISASTGAQTSAGEREARLGDCSDSAPEKPSGSDGGGGGGGGSDSAAVIAIAVVLVVLVCAGGGLFAYFKLGKEEQITTLGAAFNNPVYQQPGAAAALAAPAYPGQDDGELYDAQDAAGHTSQATYGMEVVPQTQAGPQRTGEQT